MKRIDASVYGRVQGVSFRYYTQKEANRLNLTGWVANVSDGSVKVIAEGPEEDLKKLVDYLYSGSPGANVEKVNTVWKTPTNEFRRFSVRWQ